ncbi:hypothetical protein LZ31DRAFT_568383 [Colletotrichum somersetense]|nr:hypothetical protein LZ31DRAFT_568383 [Colletotrichum somersetense]
MTSSNVDDSAAAGRAMHFYHTVAAPALTGDPALVLFVCVLFVCIELLRNSPRNAIAHCQHGINILNEVQAESDFLRRHVVPAMHHRWATLRKRRRGSHTTDNYTDPDGALSAQRRREAVGRGVRGWHGAFQALKAVHRPDSKEHAALYLLEIRYIINKTHLSRSNSTSENDYDAHLNDFRAVVDLAARATASSGHGGSSRTTSFCTDDSAIELGLSPLLYFVVSKCRFLTVRIAAVKLMEQLARLMDNVWIKPVTAAVARRIIEFEHRISLGDLDMGDWVDDGELPPEERRVVSVDFRWAGVIKSDGFLRQVSFLSRDPASGRIISRDEWLSLEH